jgi:hypothetical protein
MLKENGKERRSLDGIFQASPSSSGGRVCYTRSDYWTPRSILEVEWQGDGRITAITRTSWNARELEF